MMHALRLFSLRLALALFAACGFMAGPAQAQPVQAVDPDKAIDADLMPAPGTTAPAPAAVATPVGTPVAPPAPDPIPKSCYTDV